jgi:allophanate hydrolase subunit 2
MMLKQLYNVGASRRAKAAEMYKTSNRLNYRLAGEPLKVVQDEGDVPQEGVMFQLGDEDVDVTGIDAVQVDETV